MSMGKNPLHSQFFYVFTLQNFSRTVQTPWFDCYIANSFFTFQKFLNMMTSYITCPASMRGGAGDQESSSAVKASMVDWNANEGAL